MSQYMPIEIYESLSCTSFPLEIEAGIFFNDVELICDQCNSEMKQIKAIYKRLNNRCIELYFGAMCNDCDLYDSIKLRWYYKENRMMSFSDAGLENIVLRTQSEMYNDQCQSFFMKTIRKYQQLMTKVRHTTDAKG